MANESLASFWTYADSRILASRYAYDVTTHSYDPAYIDPKKGKGWRVTFDASRGYRYAHTRSDPEGIGLSISLPETEPLPGMDIEDEIESWDQDQTWHGGGSGGSRNPPDEVAKYEWAVAKTDGSFAKEATIEPPRDPWWRYDLRLPTEGRYKVTLKVHLKDGSVVERTKRFRLRDFLVVSVGDSFASGEGNPQLVGGSGGVFGTGGDPCDAPTLLAVLEDKFGLKPAHIAMGDRSATWVEPRAHRSYVSAHAEAVKLLEGTTEGADGVEELVVITYLAFARSGAEIVRGLIGPNDGEEWIGMGQVPEVKRAIGDRKIDALLISIGGNDVGFAGRLKDLVLKENPWLQLYKATSPEGARREVSNSVRTRLKLLVDELEALYGAIDKLLQGTRHVFISEYPTGLFEELETDSSGEPKAIDGAGCEIFEPFPGSRIDVKDGKKIKELGEDLNKVIKAKADEFGWHYVGGIAERFAGHGYCSDTTFWVNAGTSCRRQGDFRGVMHPNHRGTKVYAEQISAAMREQLMAPRWQKEVGRPDIPSSSTPQQELDRSFEQTQSGQHATFGDGAAGGLPNYREIERDSADYSDRHTE